MPEGAWVRRAEVSGAESLRPLLGLWVLFTVELRLSECLGEEPKSVFGKDPSGVCAGSGLWGQGEYEETRGQLLPSPAGGGWGARKSSGLEGRTGG